LAGRALRDLVHMLITGAISRVGGTQAWGDCRTVYEGRLATSSGLLPAFDDRLGLVLPIGAGD
jgi:hypothetical protein